MDNSAEIENKIKKFNYLIEDGEHHMITFFPERIRHINKMLEMPEFHNELNYGFPENIVENNLYNCNLPINENFKKITDMMKPIVKQLYEDANILKIWILLLVPKIEDGSDFGVGIQQNIIKKVCKAQAYAFITHDEVGMIYHLTRAKIISKILKRPYDENNVVALREFDEKHLIKARKRLLGVRCIYATIFDTIIKNLEKIKNPQPELAESFH